MSHFAAFLDKNKLLASPSPGEKLAQGSLHPYYPVDLEIDGYVQNELPVLTLLAIFSAGCLVLFLSTWLIVRRVRSNMPLSELAIVLWFVLSGFLHIFFEGYFVFNFKSMGHLQTVFGQLWKEYALSDSRYLNQSTIVFCMETITMSIWGPLSLLTASLIAIDSPYRHPFQMIVSLAHVYGDVLYFATAAFDEYMLGKQYSRPEAYYFWGYYVFMNAIWIVIPFFLLWNSVATSAGAFTALHRTEKALKANGFSKKKL